MKINPGAMPASLGPAVQHSQLTCRVAAHQSSPTSRPVEPPCAIGDDTTTRRPTRHTFDIRV